MKHHLIIAGTGRAGTSFLVQYFTACGLETHQALHPQEVLDPYANAGLEDVPDEGTELPYVIKSPWLYEFVDRLLSRTDITIDAVVLPMRDIVEAASSRVILEMRARVGNDAGEEHSQWETWGATPGGVVYSLNPLDQARLLAMGFHHVIHKLVQRDVPIIFLDFPRFVDDGEYLYRQLNPVIGSKVDHQTALSAHGRTANSDLIRVGKELSGSTERSSVSEPGIGYPSHEFLDRNALFRQLKKWQTEAGSTQARLDSLYSTLQARDETLKNQNEALERLMGEVAALSMQAGQKVLDEENLRAEIARLTQLVNATQEQSNSLRQERDQILGSTIWKVTKPVRTVISIFKIMRRN